MIPTIGLDFGTTNTVATLIGPDGVEAVRFSHDGEAFDAFRSVLCFSEPEEPGPTRVTAGPSCSTPSAGSGCG